MQTTRRELIALSGAALAAKKASAQGKNGASSNSATLPKRKLGKTGVEVPILCMGGYHLGTLESEAAAKKLVHEAIDNGLTFFDNAWEYLDGKCELWMGSALEGKRDQVFLMTKLCTHGRDKRTAMEQLETSLRRLKTDHLDLWQIHEVAWDDDPKNHYRKDGAVEALAQAKKDGKVRFVGFTGHKSPALHLEMLKGGFAFDTVQMPINPFDGSYDSFEQKVLPELSKKGIAGLGMKSLTGTAKPIKEGLITPEECIRYALSTSISALVSGIDSSKVLKQNLSIVRGFKPYSAEEMEAVLAKVRNVAKSGKYEEYKVSTAFEGPIGRAQHGRPAIPEN